MTQAGLFYHNMRHLIKNKNTQITVNESQFPIPQMEEKKKRYSAHDVNRAYCARKFRHTTVKPIKIILHAVEDNILQNLPNLREDVGMAEYINVRSVSYFQCKMVQKKIQYVEPVVVISVLKDIHEK